MKGRPRTTGRGRTAGGREARAWLSADEHTAAVAAAKGQGVTLGEFLRALVLDAVASTTKRLTRPSECA